MNQAAFMWRPAIEFRFLEVRQRYLSVEVDANQDESISLSIKFQQA